jgi:mRNA interferase RelE/StbE
VAPRYRVEFKPSAAKAVEKLPRPAQRRVLAAAAAHADDPRPDGCRKLEGEPDLYRVRVGDYRLVYTVRDRVLLVLIVRVGHRRDVYR